VRAVALDVHRDFCKVAIGDEDGVRAAGRIRTRPDELELFAQSLDSHDHVALEVTGGACWMSTVLPPAGVFDAHLQPDRSRSTSGQ
jgi:hypothetical protein